MQIWNWLPYIPGKVLSSYGLFLFFPAAAAAAPAWTIVLGYCNHSFNLVYLFSRYTFVVVAQKSAAASSTSSPSRGHLSLPLSVVVNHPYFIGENDAAVGYCVAGQRSSCWGWLRSSDTLPLLQFDGNVRWWLGWELYLPPGPTTVVWLYCIGHHHSFWKNIFDPIIVSSRAFFVVIPSVFPSVRRSVCPSICPIVIYTHTKVLVQFFEANYDGTVLFIHSYCMCNSCVIKNGLNRWIYSPKMDGHNKGPLRLIVTEF